MVELSVALIISISMGLTLGPFCTRLICKPLDVYEDQVAAPAREKAELANSAKKARHRMLSRGARKRQRKAMIQESIPAPRVDDQPNRVPMGMGRFPGRGRTIHYAVHPAHYGRCAAGGVTARTRISLREACEIRDIVADAAEERDAAELDSDKHVMGARARARQREMDSAFKHADSRPMSWLHNWHFERAHDAAEEKANGPHRRNAHAAEQRRAKQQREHRRLQQAQRERLGGRTVLPPIRNPTYSRKDRRRDLRRAGKVVPDASAEV